MRNVRLFTESMRVEKMVDIDILDFWAAYGVGDLRDLCIQVPQEGIHAFTHILGPIGR